MGLEDCAGGGLRCSRYLGLFDCAVVRFWFHEYELIVDFVVDEHGRLASVVIEGPVFRRPGVAQVRVDCHTRYSSLYRDFGCGDYCVVLNVACNSVRKVVTVRYGSDDFVMNPCRYIGEIREAITRSSDDATVQVFRTIMNILDAEYSVGDFCLG